MTTLEKRPNTALLVVDVQNAVVGGAHERDAVVANVGRLVEKARRERVPVVWVQHSDEQIVRGSDGWRIVPELTPGDAEPLIEKSYGDSFEDTTLETVLSGLGVGRLVVVGAETDACIRSTLHGAFVRGYDALLVSDAHTAQDQTAWGAPPPDQVIAHTNLYWTYQTAPGRTAGTGRDQWRRLRLTANRASSTAAGADDGFWRRRLGFAAEAGRRSGAAARGWPTPPAARCPRLAREAADRRSACRGVRRAAGF
jgi:Isochorismatase family